MLKDQQNKRDVYKPCPYWTQYSKRTADAIITDGVETFRSNSRIGKGYADNVLMDPFDLLSNDSLKHKVHRFIRNNPAIKKYFLEPYKKQLKRQYREAQLYRNLYYTNILGDWFDKFSKKHPLPDTLVGNPQDTVTINGQKIGSSYLYSFLRVYNYSKHIDFSKIESVFEVGGGFGSFSHTLLHLYPNIRKLVYLDIPPILYVGTQYLKHFYHNEVVDYTQTSKLENLSFESNDKREIIAICPWQIENLDTKFDLFWNSASFQEMTPDVVGNYTRHTNRLLKVNGKLCLMMYKAGHPDSTIMPDKLIDIIRKNTSFEPKEFDAEMNISDDHYFIGSKNK